MSECRCASASSDLVSRVSSTLFLPSQFCLKIHLLSRAHTWSGQAAPLGHRLPASAEKAWCNPAHLGWSLGIGPKWWFLQVRPLNQQKRHRLGKLEKHAFSGPAPAWLSQKLGAWGAAICALNSPSKRCSVC